MHVAKCRLHGGSVVFGCLEQDQLIVLSGVDPSIRTLADLLEQPDPTQSAKQLAASATERVPAQAYAVLAPIDQQEVWAAGVTYRRSKTARMEESDVAASCYDRVYQSARPELFMKATPHRVVGPNQPLGIRTDSKWDVPEPELTLVMNSRMDLVGFTIGNDMSSRDIEGENPLYLPQAKVYNACCGLGPVITLRPAMPALANIGIRLEIHRSGTVAFQGATRATEMARTFEELIGWLGRENRFPQGVFLMTGTGVVPDSDFTLQPDDQVSISIDGIGTLTNPIRPAGEL